MTPTPEDEIYPALSDGRGTSIMFIGSIEGVDKKAPTDRKTKEIIDVIKKKPYTYNNRTIGEAAVNKLIDLNITETQWRTLRTIEEKKQKLQAIVTAIENAQGIRIEDRTTVEIANLDFEVLDEDGRKYTTYGRYKHNDRKIYINEKVLERDSLKQLIKTTLHETYHAYQHNIADKEGHRLKPQSSTQRYYNWLEGRSREYVEWFAANPNCQRNNEGKFVYNNKGLRGEIKGGICTFENYHDDNSLEVTAEDFANRVYENYEHQRRNARNKR
jgi:hypothetical protein